MNSAGCMRNGPSTNQLAAPLAVWPMKRRPISAAMFSPYTQGVIR